MHSIGNSRIRSLAAGLTAAASAMVGAVAPLAAQATQELRVSVVQENLRQQPGGTLLAVVMRDTPLDGGAARDQWREVTLEGWIPAASVRPTSRDGFDLAVAPGGATIHKEPGGPAVARGLGGFLLDEVGRSDDWVQVRRTAWIWSASIRETAPAAAATDVERSAGEPAPAPRPAGPRTLRSAPGGSELGTLASEAPMEVVGREGEWARVRVEGWIRVDAVADAEAAPAPSERLSNLSLRALRENPDEYRGRTLAWRVQFISVQHADSLRTDFSTGEEYILARDPGGEPGFVYIAVPPHLSAAARRLVPLQQVEVVGRVRTGRSELMGHPVLELVELRS